ncbi:MAG: SUMF1/EgtB/PvdO family nonheme iron enzyme, partial [Chloroflexota bacterium]
RILSYQPPKSKDDPDLRLASFPEFELAPFDDEKIGAFIEAWYKELAHLKIVPSDLAADSNRSLKKAIHRPELAELAPNPLLLTVMAVVNTHKGRLPDTRAVLYKEAVEILLWRWEQGSKGQEARLRQLLLDAKCQEIDLEQVIWKLAYEAHAQTSETDNKNRTLAGIGELTLQKSLASLNKGDLNWAARVIESMKLRAGLLLERDPGVFSFPHRSFQEFLAGTYLEAQDDFVSRARELADNQLLWRETILWAVSRRVYVRGSTDGPLALVAELCPSRPCCSPEEWSRVWLAGDILLETGLNRVERSELGNELLPRVRTRLVSLLEQSALTPRERAAAGDTLARLGDPRFDDEAWQLPKEGLLGFVHIPAGGFLMGTKEDDIQGLIKKFGGGKDYYKAEVPQHPLALPDYYLARYPVTVAQFKAFVIESGYEPGNEASLQGVDNHPVRYVTWFDAVAYCDWLDQKLKAIAPGKKAAGETEKAFWQGLEDGRLRVTLPSEAEWEKAARGTSLLEGEGRVRAFPWGNEITPNHANYNETGIGSTCAVGCFPRGTSPYGLLDLSGNVWEWTRSIYKEYPYQPDKGRETMDDKKSVRGLRGGAFDDDDRRVRCAFRVRNYPLSGWDYDGFRVVVASPISLPRSGS